MAAGNLGKPAWNAGATRGLVDDQGRECSRCHIYKLWDEFSPSAVARTGYQSACKECRNRSGADARDAQDSAERRAARFGSGRTQACKRMGITVAQYDWLHVQQGGKCALCLQEETALAPRWQTLMLLSIDHDHTCPEHAAVNGCLLCIRGLLCRDCNIMIGLAEKRGAVVTVRFQDYLEQRPFDLASASVKGGD